MPVRAALQLLLSIIDPPVALPLWLRNVCLGKLVHRTHALLMAAASWDRFITGFHGWPHLSSNLETVDHPTSPLLIE